MKNLHLILFIYINAVCCYHFYNPSSHQLLAASSLNTIPGGYRLLRPARSYRRRSRLTRGRINTTCGDGGFTCDTPYNKSSTIQFECTSDNQCPSNYKCCPQKCFLHKICIQASPQVIDGGKRRKCEKNRPGQCEKWPYNCRTPYDYASTYIFKCNRDGQCPKSYKCCQQSCFLHKICSKIVKDVETPPIKIEIKPHEKVTPTPEQTENEEEEYTEKDTTEATTSTTEENSEVEQPVEPDQDYNENEDDESDTAEVPEATEVVEEDSTTEAEIETTQTNSNKQETTTEEDNEPTKEDEEENTIETELDAVEGKTEVTKVVIKNVSNTTTPDSNAINSNADDYNEEDYKEEEEYDYVEEGEEEEDNEDEAYTY